jgi:hypothetical protein
MLPANDPLPWLQPITLLFVFLAVQRLLGEFPDAQAVARNTPKQGRWHAGPICSTFCAVLKSKGRPFGEIGILQQLLLKRFFLTCHYYTQYSRRHFPRSQ